MQREQAEATWKVRVSWVRSARVPDTVTVRWRTAMPKRASTAELPLSAGVAARSAGASTASVASAGQQDTHHACSVGT